MEISELTLKLILLLIPGGISCIIFQKLTIHKKWNSFQFILNAILFSAICYLVIQGVCYIIKDTLMVDFWKNLPQKVIPFWPLLIAVLISIVVGGAACALDHHKVLSRFGKYIGISTKYGEESLYYYFLNAKNVREVYVRDIENDLTYHGLIDSFNEEKDIKEIVLRDVKVYQYTTSALLYSVDKVYLHKVNANLIIEVP